MNRRFWGMFWFSIQTSRTVQVAVGGKQLQFQMIFINLIPDAKYHGNAIGTFKGESRKQADRHIHAPPTEFVLRTSKRTHKHDT